MTITIKKISNYALLSTIISTNATAPAQATLVQNITADEEFINTPQKQTSLSRNQNILTEVDKSNYKDNFCISLPEFDLCNEFKNDKTEKSLNNSLLRKAKTSLELIRDGEAIKVKTSADQIYYIYDIELDASTVVSAEKKQKLYLNTYTNVKQQFGRVKKKVPEPSLLLGLIVFCLLAAKHQPTKK